MGLSRELGTPVDRLQRMVDELQSHRHAHAGFSANPLPSQLDLDTPGIRVLVARGGPGSLGNGPLATSSRERLRSGLAGESRRLSLTLKTVADVGLVGLPNAGKSSLLRHVSRAAPKVAPYPFTTLNPFVGTLDLPGGDRITLADIPGIVMGAHVNFGLGFAFLRHVERAHVLVFVIDVSEGGRHRNSDSDSNVSSGSGSSGSDGSVESSGSETSGSSDSDTINPPSTNTTPNTATANFEAHLDLWTLLRELELYDARLLDKPSVVLANKIDRLLPADAAAYHARNCSALLDGLPAVRALRDRVPRRMAPRLRVFPISARYGLGVDAALRHIQALVHQARSPPVE